MLRGRGQDRRARALFASIQLNSAWTRARKPLAESPFFAEGDNFVLSPNSCITFGPTTPVRLPELPLLVCAALTGPGSPAVTGVTKAQGFRSFTAPPRISTSTEAFYFPADRSHPVWSNIQHHVSGHSLANVFSPLPTPVQWQHFCWFPGTTSTPTTRITHVSPNHCGVTDIPRVHFHRSRFCLALGVGHAILEFGDIGKTTYNSFESQPRPQKLRHGLLCPPRLHLTRTPTTTALTAGLGLCSVLLTSRFPIGRSSIGRRLRSTQTQLYGQRDLRLAFLQGAAFRQRFGTNDRFTSRAGK